VDIVNPIYISVTSTIDGTSILAKYKTVTWNSTELPGISFDQTSNSLSGKPTGAREGLAKVDVILDSASDPDLAYLISITTIPLTISGYMAYSIDPNACLNVNCGRLQMVY
jgi:hypothetical protein